MQDNGSSFPLLVVSCDKYADVWPYFFGLLRRRWPDCPFPILLGSNELSPDLPGVTSVPVGPDSSWSTGARKMLDRVTELYPDADYVLLFLEDFLLIAPVDTARIVDLVQIARQKKVGCLRLAAGLPLALPPTYEISEFPGVGVVTSGEPNRVTLQAAVWQVETLRRLLPPGLSAWEFEMVGTHMSEGLDAVFWAVVRPAIEYAQAIEKGKWKPEGLAILRNAGLDVSTLARGVFSEAELVSHYSQSREESANSEYRGAALRSFLGGRRTEGLRHIWRGIRQGNPTLADLTLSLVGSLGRAATRKALSIYVRLRLRSYSRRESKQ